MKRTSSTLGDYFVSRRERGDEGLPLVSVTLRDGLVPRNTIERRFESELEDHEHLAVRKGDIAYNMMRMWQGASGLAHYDAAVSPAYVVLRPSKEIDPTFASYWFKSARMIYLFWAYSYGLTEDRLRLYYKDFAAIPAAPPPLSDQRKISAVLSECDRAIHTIDALLTAKQQARRALMKRLMSGITNKAELLDFAALRKATQPGTGSSIELENIESGTGRLLGKTLLGNGAGNRFQFKAGDTLFGRLRPYLDKRIFAQSAGLCSTEIWVLSPDENVCRPRFLYALTQTSEFKAAANVQSGSKMPRAEWEVVSEAPLPLPSLAEQDRIVGALTAADDEIDLLAGQAEALRRQKRGLMQRLFVDHWCSVDAGMQAVAG